MKTIIRRNDVEVTREESLNQFRSALSSKEEQFTQSAIEALVDEHAKNLTDNFIVMDKEELRCPLIQGDIKLYHESSDYFKEVEKSIGNLKETDNFNLQIGKAKTGDHRIIPLEGAKITLKEGNFEPKDDVLNGRKYDCKYIESDKPFLIKHSEHGNIAVQAGTYLVFTAIQPRTRQRIID
jgi:hypothetical protein